MIEIGVGVTSLPALQNSVSETAINRVAVIGQSENVVGWLDNGTFQTGYAAANGLYQTPLPGLDVEFCIPTAANNDGTGAPGVYAVTAANIAAGNLSPGAVAMANLLHLASNGAAWRVAGVCKSGTGMGEMMDNDDPDRLFTVDQATVAAAVAAWGPIENVLVNWYVAESGTSQNYYNLRVTHFYGINVDGTDYDFAAGELEHCLIDTRAVQTGGDLGLFGISTKVHVMYPGNYIDFAAQSTLDPAYPNYTTNAAGNALGGRIDDNGIAANAQRRYFIERSPAANRGIPTVSPALAVMGDYENGSQKAGNAQVSSHPALQTKLGQNLYSQDVGFALACAFGFAQPTTFDRIEVDESGSHVDFIFSLPPGATLTTHRIADGLTVASPRPHQQTVMGFVIRRSGDTARNERPVFRTDLATTGDDLTEYPLDYRGTVTIHDTGTDVTGGREGIVRVTPLNAFSNGDMITWGGDGGYGGFILHGFEDYDAQLCLDGLRAYEARLDDGTSFGYPGGPVVHQVQHAITELPGGNSAPVAATVEDNDGSFSGINGPTVSEGTVAVTLVFEGEIPNLAITGTHEILAVQADALFVRADVRAAQRRMEVRLEDSAGTVLVNNADLGEALPTDDGTSDRIMITASQDDGSGNWRCAVYVNDARVGAELTGTTSGTGFMQSTGIYEILKGGANSRIGRVVVWEGSHADAYSTDGILPTSTPLVTLEGDAAYWNGTGLPSGWSTAGAPNWTNIT